MKKITRRLYSKPVMLGMAFLIGIALLVGLSVTTGKSRAAQSGGFPILAGNDEFETPANGETFHDFGGSPIPANFFGPGSLAFNQLVALEGVPLSAGSDVDTIIQRHQTVSAPGDSTQLTMTGLSLKSTNAITVSYSGGGTESWNMEVGLSQFQASTGSMTVNASTMDSNLKVWPRFVFTRLSDGLTKVLDTGSGAGLTAAATATAGRGGTDEAIAISPIEPLPAPCKIAVIDATELRTKSVSATAAAAAPGGCPPVTLSCVNSPWFPCGLGGICFPPLTEAERWARHNPWPKGTKHGGAVGE
jgi:hypothetical protein